MRYGFVKPYIDIHTLGLTSISELVKQCGYYVHICDAIISHALDHPEKEVNEIIIINWLRKYRITHLGFSYRLDPKTGQELFGRLYKVLKKYNILDSHLKYLAVAGLPELCKQIKNEYGGRIFTFSGEESPIESLLKLGIPHSNIPIVLTESYEYKNELELFGKELLESEAHLKTKVRDLHYSDFGTTNDNLLLRIKNKKKICNYPVFRAHAGPFLPDRIESIRLFRDWLKILTISGELDVLSIGSSQMSQSNFGEKWDNRINGGGIPFNSEEELHDIFLNSRPMLLRAYSGTQNVPYYAGMLDKTINNAWHALSLWWFNLLDGRGPLNLRECLIQHMLTMDYLAASNKIFEPNVGHHFSFRGSDDITYIISTLLATKLAKRKGIKTIVLQNMLNTPRNTSFKQDIIKSRALLRLVKSLENDSFRIIYQPRAGLDYFSADLDKACIQLVSVTALMKDIVFMHSNLLEVLHVVSYSEGVGLANPDIINQSIRICKAVFDQYDNYKRKVDMSIFYNNKEINEKTSDMVADVQKLMDHLESTYHNLYSPQGFYQIFIDGVLPVPFLWEGRNDFPLAVDQRISLIDGSMKLLKPNGDSMHMDERIQMLRILKKNNLHNE